MRKVKNSRKKIKVIKVVVSKNTLMCDGGATVNADEL